MNTNRILEMELPTRMQQVSALALGLSHAEDALQQFTAGQVDAVIDPSGRMYLLREAQEKMREKEMRLQDIIDCGADVITVVNRGGSILSQSDAGRRILGYDPHELTGKSIFSYVHSADLFNIFSAFLNVVEEFRESDVARFRHRVRDGSYRTLEATLRKVDGTVPALVVFNLRPVEENSFTAAIRSGMAEMVPQRKVPPASPPETPDAKQTPLASFETFPDFIVVDKHGWVHRESCTLPRVLGYENEALLGRSMFEFVHPEDLLRVQLVLSDVMRQNSPTTLDVQFRHRMPDGSWTLIEATIGTLQPGPSTEIIVIFRGSAQIRQEKEEATQREVCFEKASVAKDQFLAMLSHELLTPLSPVLLGLTELEEDEKFAEAKPIFAMMRRNLIMQTRLLEELRYFTTIEQHKVRLQFESIDAHDAIRFVVEICRAEIAEAGISVQLELHAEDKIVRADSVRFQQVMWNLLKNAIKFSPAGGSITILSANDVPNRLSIAFVDHGIGIQSDLLPLVFDPFQQGDRSIRSSYGGLGLGLFIAKGLAEAQEGALTVESPGEGLGATFRLSLRTVHPDE